MTREYGRRFGLDRDRPRVVSALPGLAHESGPPRSSDWRPEKVAVLAHWSTDATVTRSVVALIQDLDRAGYATLVVSSAGGEAPVERACRWAPEVGSFPDATTVVRRTNVGHDFGSWAAALAHFPGIPSARWTLLINDSLVGPFTALGGVLADFESSPDPVWGIVGAEQHRPHLQSFFVGYRHRVLLEPSLRSFWADIRVERNKAKVVRFNELGLAETLDSAGIQWTAMFPPWSGSAPNPTLQEARTLTLAGMPFVKRQVALPASRLAPGEGLRGVIEDAFDQDLRSWVGPIDEQSVPGAGPLNGPSHVLSQVRTLMAIEGPLGVARALSSRVTN